jgi:hypothetical protein
MRSKGRYSVAGHLNARLIKDFYLLPLLANESPPDILLPLDRRLEPIGARSNTILCIVVRNRDDTTMIPNRRTDIDLRSSFDDDSVAVSRLRSVETDDWRQSSISPTMIHASSSMQVEVLKPIGYVKLNCV